MPWEPTTWRRVRTRKSVRVWDKDFNLIGTITDDTTVESWGHWARRIGRRLTPWPVLAWSPLLLIAALPIGWW